MQRQTRVLIAGLLVALPLFGLAPATDPAAAATHRWRIFIDAGHGAKDNVGALSCTCEPEERFDWTVADDLRRALGASNSFVARISRGANELVEYPVRLADAEEWAADAFVSIHADARGDAEPWQPVPGTWCFRNDNELGFTILFSDEAAPPLVAMRRRLAARIAARLIAAGFVPYDGRDYFGLYEAESTQAGVFVDRHAPKQRLFMLRRPSMPSVIIETHHALAFDEAERWHDPATLAAFDRAVLLGLTDALSTRAP